MGWDADRDFQATEYGTRLHLRCRDNSLSSAPAERIHRPLINSTGPYAISADALCAGLSMLCYCMIVGSRTGGCQNDK